MPEIWAFAVLAAVAFRITRLVGWDDITTRLRGWISVTDARYSALIKIVDDRAKAGDSGGTALGHLDEPIPAWRWYLARLIRCPWCAGFWVSMIVSLAASGAGLQTWGWAVPVGLALSAIVGLTVKHLDSWGNPPQGTISAATGDKAAGASPVKRSRQQDETRGQLVAVVSARPHPRD